MFLNNPQFNRGKRFLQYQFFKCRKFLDFIEPSVRYLAIYFKPKLKFLTLLQLYLLLCECRNSFLIQLLLETVNSYKSVT